MDLKEETGVNMGFRKTVTVCVAFLVSMYLLIQIVGLAMLFIPVARLLFAALIILYLFLLNFSVRKLAFLNKNGNRKEFISKHRLKFLSLNAIIILSLLLPLILPAQYFYKNIMYKAKVSKDTNQTMVICEAAHADFASPLNIQDIILYGNGTFIIGDKKWKIVPTIDFGHHEDPTNERLVPSDLIGKEAKVEIAPCNASFRVLFDNSKLGGADQQLEVFKNFPYDMNYVLIPGKITVDGHWVYTYSGTLIRKQ